VIGSAKFQEAEMELPIALGKTISNETFVVDLAKMPLTNGRCYGTRKICGSECRSYFIACTRNTLLKLNLSRRS
jgi:hypothetical protein